MCSLHAALVSACLRFPLSLNAGLNSVNCRFAPLKRRGGKCVTGATDVVPWPLFSKAPAPRLAAEVGGEKLTFNHAMVYAADVRCSVGF
jgi:hypothetical protein